MKMFWLPLFLTLTYFPLSDTFILPLKKNNGSLDVEHLVGHMTLLEQTITGFQQTITSQNADIASLKTEILNLKASQQIIGRHSTDISSLKTDILKLIANQQTIASHHADIASLKTEISNLKTNQQMMASHSTDISSLQTEISNLKADQQTIVSDHVDIATLTTEISNLKSNQLKLDQRISDLQKQAQPGQMAAEVTSLKNEVNAAKMEVTLVSNEVISLTSKINNLTQDYQSLSFQVMSDQNVTRSVHDIQKTLGRVLTHVHSAENDRFLLHNHVNSLNRTLSGFSKNSNVNATALSAQIAQLQTKVGFAVWIGSSYVQLRTSIVYTLKFSNIQYNIGHGYNSSTGVFTAPVSGIYLFWTQVTKARGQRLGLFLKKGNSGIGGFYTSADVTGSIITAAPVKAGEQVYVTINGVETLNCCAYTSFGGSLLYRN